MKQPSSLRESQDGLASGLGGLESGVAAVAVQGFGPATVYQPSRSVTVAEEFAGRTNEINVARPFTLKLHQS